MEAIEFSEKVTNFQTSKDSDHSEKIPPKQLKFTVFLSSDCAEFDKLFLTQKTNVWSIV